MRFLHQCRVVTRSTRLLSVVVAALSCSLLSCNGRGEQTAVREPATQTVRADDSTAAPPRSPEQRTPQQVVEEFGKRMKQVSTSASSEIAARALREHYEGLVDSELLQIWIANPATAPGRQVSSPWPDRIEVESSSRTPADEVVVTGALVEATSSGETRRIPIQVRLRRSGASWVITAYDVNENPAQVGEGAEAAVAVIRDYYQAIASRDYERAYGHWGSSGPPGQSLESFVSGFADTASVEAKTGKPSRIEPAAGSRYIEIPITISAIKKSGGEQRFEGTYTLRRSVVEGAPASDVAWHIYRAALRQAAP